MRPITLGRFLVGALGSGLIIILLPNIDFRVTRSEFQKLAGLSIFYAATPVLLYEAYRGISTGLATTLHFTYRHVKNHGKSRWACPTCIMEGKAFCESKQIPEEIIMRLACDLLN